MMTADELPPGSKHCTFVFGHDTFKPIVWAVVENPDRHVSLSGNWDAGSSMSYAKSKSVIVGLQRCGSQATYMVHDPVNGTTEEGRGKNT